MAFSIFEIGLDIVVLLGQDVTELQKLGGFARAVFKDELQ